MKKKIFCLLIILSFVFVLNGTVTFETENRGNDAIPDNEEKLQSALDKILVKYKKQADLWIQESVKASIEATYGIQEIREFSFIDVYLYKTYGDKERTLEKLNKNPNIEYAEPDYVRYIDSTVPNDPYFADLWGLHNEGQTGGTVDADIDAPEAWDLTTGSSNVIVAVVDSGVDYNHDDLIANMWTNPGEIPNNSLDDDGNGYIDDYYGINTVDDSGDPMDDRGHGTHCAGIIAAAGNNDIGVAGVCWTAKIMALKFLDADGEGYISDEVKCIEYAIEKGAHIINASLGGPGFSYSEKRAIDSSKDAGILFVAAAGNDGSDNDEKPFYPASCDCDNIIAVAATNYKDNLASFSNYGAYSVDVAAPGASIYSTVPNNQYSHKSGTSMATPCVAGLAALILSYYGPPAQEKRILSLDWQQVKNRILSGADQISSLEGKILTRGRINAFNSLDSGDITSYSLDIQSSPMTGAYVEVSPNDLSGGGDGHTNFSRLYAPYSTVTLTAPATYNERNFAYWTLEGSKYSEGQEISIKMDFNHTAVAFYPLWTLAVDSKPDTNVYIEISPNDMNGQGGGHTNFTREYSHGTEVTLTAPAEFSGKKFVRWLTNGKNFDESLTTSIDMQSDCSLTAYYSDKLKWKYDVGTSFLDLSPAVGSDGIIYVVGRDLYAINPDGTKKWEFSPWVSVQTSPAIGLDGTIFIGCTYGLYALNLDGEEKWEFTADSLIDTDLAIGSDGTVYFGDWDKKLYAINPDGGKKWEFTAGCYLDSSPSIGSDGTIYFGGQELYAINPDGTKKWEFSPFGSIWSSPSIGSDGTIYIGTFDLYALNPDGTEKWEFFSSGSIHSSPAIGLDGTIYFGSTNDDFYALNPDGTKKWEFTADDRIWSSPALGSDGTIYFGSYDHKFYALNPDGTKKWEFITGDSIESSPAIGSDGTIYFVSEDDYLYALESDSQGLASSSWPKLHHDNKNTGRAPSGADISPSVSIISPSDGESVSGTVMVQVSAFDDNEVNKVEFYIDDELKSTDTISPYAYSWDTKPYSNGSYKVKAIAYDNVCQTNSDEISVDVHNNPAISGYVRTSGGSSGIQNVVMGGLPGDPTTDADGYYSGTVDFGWSGTVTPSKATYTFSPSNRTYANVNSDQLNQDYTASLVQCTLTIAAGAGGTTSPAPNTYTHDYGTQIQVTAIPSSGYQFSGWSGAASGTTNPITITMDADKSITASFSSTQTGESGGGDGGGKKGGCFIATAAYGSPLHPHLDILRDFRDKCLMPSEFGNMLVDIYYKYSPFAANFIAEHKLLKVYVRANLLPLVVLSYSLLHLGPIVTIIMFIFVPALGMAMIWMVTRYRSRCN